MDVIQIIVERIKLRFAVQGPLKRPFLDNPCTSTEENNVSVLYINIKLESLTMLPLSPPLILVHQPMTYVLRSVKNTHS